MHYFTHFQLGATHGNILSLNYNTYQVKPHCIGLMFKGKLIPKLKLTNQVR